MEELAGYVWTVILALISFLLAYKFANTVSGFRKGNIPKKEAYKEFVIDVILAVLLLIVFLG